MKFELEIDAFLDVHNGQDQPGVVLAIVKNGDLIYQRGYGMADLEHEILITPSTVFDVASVAKQFTGFAIAKLAIEGIISLDDNVRMYLPEMPDFGDKITVQHLVHHLSLIHI